MSSPLMQVLHTAAVVLLATLVGCGKTENGSRDASQDTPPRSTDSASGGGILRIGVSEANLDEPRLVQRNADMKAAADGHANLEVVFDSAENDTLKQCGQVEQFVTDKVDLIIISPTEPQPLTDPVAKAYRAGIPVIVLDRAVIGDQYTCFLRPDDKQIGRAAGEWLANKLGGRGKIVELKGTTDSTQGEDRHTGFREALRDFPDVRILFEAGMEWDEAEARKKMESALARFDQVDAVYAHNDAGAHGAYLAAQAAGREDEMLLIGIDALPDEGIAYVKQGILDATFQYPTGGAEAIDTALKILAGQQVPKTIVLGSRVFTAENVDQGGRPVGAGGVKVE